MTDHRRINLYIAKLAIDRAYRAASFVEAHFPGVRVDVCAHPDRDEPFDENYSISVFVALSELAGLVENRHLYLNVYQTAVAMRWMIERSAREVVAEVESLRRRPNPRPVPPIVPARGVVTR